jgi:glycosyltransferase involved in cell wall biosynthesis
MKTVLLLYPEMLFYKVPIFNKLCTYLEKRGYKLIIWYTRISDPNNECSFNRIVDTPMTLANYMRVLKENKVDIVIDILFKRDPGYYFYYASILKTRFSGIPVIFYGHGIDKQKDNWLINTIYNLTHFMFNGLILYTPGEKSKIWKIFHPRITYANNTLDMEKVAIPESIDELKLKYNINSPRIILTTGRLQSRKRIEILRDIFIRNYKDSPDVGWVLVGPELSDDIKNSIEGIKNIYYLGPIYDKVRMAEVFALSDIYCVPGALGLGIVEAFFWGLPVLTMNVNHGPEAYYLRNGYNSLIAQDIAELERMMKEMLLDDSKRKELSENASKVYSEEATLDKMFEGFELQLNRFFHEAAGTKY